MKLTKLEELFQELEQAKIDLFNCPTIFMYDENGEIDDDSYQKSIELSYWKMEQQELIRELEKKIALIDPYYLKF